MREDIALSSILGASVYDSTGAFAGHVREVAIFPQEDPNRISDFIVKTREGDRLLPSRQVRTVIGSSIQVNGSALDWVPLSSSEGMLLLERDLLDQQIIDVSGRKVVRVNDVDLLREQVNGVLKLKIGRVDIGLRGAIRRLLKGLAPSRAIEALAMRMPEKSIPWEAVDLIETDPARRVRLRLAYERLSKLHPADIADILEDLAPAERESVFNSLTEEVAAEALEEIDPKMQIELMRSIDSDKAADIVEEMDPDAAADLLGDLPQETSEGILEEMEPEERQEVSELLAFHENTAAGRMTTDYIALSAEHTVGDAIDRLRSFEGPVETMSTIYLVDAQEKLVGSVPLVSLVLAPGGTSIADFTTMFAALFLGLVALVLLIACANVANLMLARAITRQPELTMRAALGASRSRLIRQVLAESLLLAAMAGAAGWAISAWTGGLVMRFAFAFDSGFPLDIEYRPALRDYLFAAAISLFAAGISSIVPAQRASRVSLVESLKGGAGHRVAGDQHRLRNLLIVGQVVFSLVVLIGAGLFLESLRRVREIPVGFRPQRLLMLYYNLRLQGYTDERGQEFTRQLLEKVRALPGVEAAGLTQHVPFDYAAWGRDVWPENPPAQMKDGNTSILFDRVDPGFIPMLGLRVVRGRQLADTDTAAAPRVAVINQALAELCWPGENPIGKRLRWTRDGPWTEVVGVTETAKYQMISESPRPYLYLPLQQDYSAPLALMVRSRADPSTLAGALRATVQSLDPHLPVYSVRTMDHLMDYSFFARLPLRLGATLAAFQGAIGLLLAVLGLYTVVAYAVSRRTREIGIRMALGANARDVVRLVVREGMQLTAIGIVLGLVLAAALGVALSRVLYGLGALDPVAFISGTVLLLATAALACWLPARRATKVNPVVALRAE